MITDLINRLRDPIILIATIANIVGVILILKYINREEAQNINTIATLIISALVNIGILKKPNTK